SDLTVCASTKSLKLGVAVDPPMAPCTQHWTDWNKKATCRPRLGSQPLSVEGEPRSSSKSTASGKPPYANPTGPHVGWPREWRLSWEAHLGKAAALLERDDQCS